MPTYKITDPQSGKTISVTGDSPPSEQELNQIFGAVKGGSTNQGVFEQAIDKTGAFNLPGIGGLLQVLAHPLLKGAETVAEGVGALGDIPAMLQGKQISKNPRFISQDEQQQLSGSLGQATAEGLKTGAGVASYVPLEAPIASGVGLGAKAINTAAQGAISGGLYGASEQAPGSFDPTSIAGYAAGGAALAPIMKILGNPKYLTKGGVNSKIEGAVNKATKNGATDSWNDISTEIKDEVQKRLGKGKDVREAVSNFLAGETPAALGEPQVTPTDMLAMRRQISNRYGQSFIQKALRGEDVDAKVANVARDIVSRRLKDLAPDITTPDQVYSLYKKLHGDVPQLALGGGLAWLASRLLGSKVGGLVNKATQSGY